MPISIETDKKRDLTIFRLSGDLTLNELKGTIDVYRHRGVTKLELYDLSDWSGRPFAAGEVDEISFFVSKDAGRFRPEGKTAIVAAQDIHYGNARIFLALTELNLPFEISVFRSFQEAYAWLGLPWPPASDPSMA